MKARILTRTVLLVSFVSLFTDVASEMLYPVMPVYLKSIGFSIMLIGILEGVAEAIAGLSKGYFGQRSDLLRKRVPFVRAGYTLSAFSKPMMAVFTFPWWIFLARTIDRFGKGIRTGARDAILSDETTPEHKGKVFGFHRSLDTVGAAIGPVLALVYLWMYPGQYRMLFYFAFLPGLIAIGLTFFLKEKEREVRTAEAKPGFLAYLKYWNHSPVQYRYLVAGLLMFTLFNSSDAFLLLAIRQKQDSDNVMIAMYIFYNLVYAVFSYPLGVLADKIGLKAMLISGLFLFAIVYLSFGFVSSMVGILALFLLYGVYAASTEGISKALISNIALKTETATAIGFYTSFASIFTLVASSLAGVLWYVFGMKVMFIISGAGVLAVGTYFLLISKKLD
ncbi:MAG: MFS transporter [Bacteroidota bacterium]